jgi:hypothetical protein
MQSKFNARSEYPAKKGSELGSGHLLRNFLELYFPPHPEGEEARKKRLTLPRSDAILSII